MSNDNDNVCELIHGIIGSVIGIGSSSPVLIGKSVKSVIGTTLILLRFRLHVFGFCTCANIK